MSEMFIYVRDEESKLKLLDRGFELLCENGDLSVFVTKQLDKYEKDDSLNDVKYVLSDTLTF